MNTITELLTDLACQIDDMTTLTHTMPLGSDRDDLIGYLRQMRDTQKALCALVFASSVDLVAAFQASLTVITDDDTAEDIDLILGTVEARADHPTHRSIPLDEM